MQPVGEYQKAHETDHFVTLKKIHKKDVDPPQKILIVSPTSNGCDLILDALKGSSKLKIVRIGSSTNRPDLDKQFGLQIKPTDKDA